jgi:hypothetical protein
MKKRVLLCQIVFTFFVVLSPSAQDFIDDMVDEEFGKTYFAMDVGEDDTGDLENAEPGGSRPVRAPKPKVTPRLRVIDIGLFLLAAFFPLTGLKSPGSAYSKSPASPSSASKSITKYVLPNSSSTVSPTKSWAEGESTTKNANTVWHNKTLFFISPALQCRCRMDV